MADFGGRPWTGEPAGTPYFRPLADGGGHRRTVLVSASGAVGRGFKSLRARHIYLAIPHGTALPSWISRQVHGCRGHTPRGIFRHGGVAEPGRRPGLELKEGQYLVRA